MKLVLKPSQDPKVEEKISKVFSKLISEIIQDNKITLDRTKIKS